MSSSQKYWCHGCEKQINNAIDTDDGLECPDCNQLFVEILEDELIGNDGFVEEKKCEQPSAFSQPSSSSSDQTSSSSPSSGMRFFSGTNPNGASYSVQFGPFGGSQNQQVGGNIFDLFQGFGGMQPNQQQQQQQSSSSSSVGNSQASPAPSQSAQPQLPPFLRGFTTAPPHPLGGDGQQPPIMNFQQLLGNLGDMFGGSGGQQGPGGGPRPMMGIEQMLSQMVGAPISGNLGDYGFGRSLSDIMASLVDPNRHGPPPATEEAINALRHVTITEAHVASDAHDCAVCKDSFKVGESAKELPCEHMFHPDCVLPWLKEHCTCPVCRYELPTSNQFFEQLRAARNANRSSSSSSVSTHTASGNGSSGANSSQSSSAS